MSQEHVELVRRAVEAWNTEGVEALVHFYTDDVIWYPFRESPENADGFHGHDGIRDVMGGWRDSFDEYRLPRRRCATTGSVLWLGEISARMKGSGGLLKQPIGSVGWDFRDGKIGRASFFSSWDSAIEAAEGSGS